MVFCNTRRNVDFIADNLIRNGIHAKAIHGKNEQKIRIRVLEEFHKKGLGVLVCTDVAARGLDIKGVSHVYNYDIPHEPKDYIHRIGRTARAGKKGKAITILASRDYEKFGTMIQSKEINITSEKLPQLEIVRIKIDSGRDNKRFGRGGFGGRKDFGRGPRKNEGPRRSWGGDSGRRNWGSKPKRSSRSSYGRRPSSYGERLNREGSYRRDSSKDSGSYGRDRPRSSGFGGRRPSSGGSSYNRGPSSRRPSNKRRDNFRGSRRSWRK